MIVEGRPPSAEASDKTYHAKTTGIALLYSENCIS